MAILLVMRGKAEIVRDIYKLLERQEPEALLALVTPDAEFDVSNNVFNPAVWKGSEGFAGWFEQAGEVWLPPKIKVLGVDELDDGRLFSAILVENVGRESGVAVTMPFWQVWTFRDGLVSRVVHFNEEGPARREAGLDG
jgi:ketosteroid isomerase-like protein